MFRYRVIIQINSRDYLYTADMGSSPLKRGFKSLGLGPMPDIVIIGVTIKLPIYLLPMIFAINKNIPIVRK